MFKFFTWIMSGVVLCGLFVGCSTPTIKGPSSELVHDEVVHKVEGYPVVEIVGVLTNCDVDSDILNTLFRLHRSALVNTEQFACVNGLRRYPIVGESGEKTVLITPQVVDFELLAGKIRVKYTLEDKGTSNILDTFELEANGGELGMNAAIQRLVLNFEEVIVSIFGPAI